MNKELVIVFVKNIKLGKVKTRLAATIGNQGAFDVYTQLVDVTEKAIKNIKADKRIYFSEAVVENTWKNNFKAVQQGESLGDRMSHAFKQGFEDGYDRIVLIGSDLPDITESQINAGLQALHTNEVVFGPAEDGGYYLVGFSKFHDFVFQNKPWSQDNLLEETLNELKENRVSFSTLETLNDIDTFEDLIASKFYQSNTELQEKLKQLHD
ncbi:TIGR04282 family arsenosugar biosynthesis glycosyltransferase [Algibacter lectus]|uniref:TIGR04282 family arsenosugar biosynthesis glycosyltransferase n=1 Tax=Algibacter lectus TaxID=221126 RepID=UPI0026F281E2|nr:TIGR04282 family arsenosugar biosynthesis glycosyltransferase [Algibacter lectus]MDO7137980.1 TIGR04282 family arsenosugar biosynthesis glycosyltransferase [Algibacter lectus]